MEGTVLVVVVQQFQQGLLTHHGLEIKVGVHGQGCGLEPVAGIQRLPSVKGFREKRLRRQRDDMQPQRAPGLLGRGQGCAQRRIAYIHMNGLLQSGHCLSARLSAMIANSLPSVPSDEGYETTCLAGKSRT